MGTRYADELVVSVFLLPGALLTKRLFYRISKIKFFQEQKRIKYSKLRMPRSTHTVADIYPYLVTFQIQKGVYTTIQRQLAHVR
jgi:hypothetical protein